MQGPGSQNHLYVQVQVHFIKAPSQRGLTSIFQEKNTTSMHFQAMT